MSSESDIDIRIGNDLSDRLELEDESEVAIGYKERIWLPCPGRCYQSSVFNESI